MLYEISRPIWSRRGPFTVWISSIFMSFLDYCRCNFGYVQHSQTKFLRECLHLEVVYERFERYTTIYTKYYSTIWQRSRCALGKAIGLGNTRAEAADSDRSPAR